MILSLREPDESLTISHGRKKEGGGDLGWLYSYDRGLPIKQGGVHPYTETVL